ncbi:hemerythrin domain-containing protein [Aggregicoccus sp. 17bor-14]|uniref:hemerythrin domain-containing protein n=1 Tax=Myxococcaceae TaxID=31 RepID=UPI00129CE224|nr:MULTISPECIES: hemerythrin domain-containing protein [Myxococcaceae]MBF5043477.1 hemerythrin domain-containing protein [Simulacricoccus sp. 17bor-14]MRI89235.1 hemerythrin domain-containing protein [Aggregicoccus sp. 17bor-14]
MDAIELLTQQHQQLDALFKRVHASEGTARVQALGELAELVTLHAALEETFFYPFAQRAGLRDLVRDAWEEHATVRQLTSELLQVKQTDPRLDVFTSDIELNLRGHIHEEERDMFPQVRERVEAGTLQALGREMVEAIARLREKELLRLAEHELPPSPMP